ncbi:J domain-containing protein [Massilia sp. W12]|uniref:J domain-containing protein n=1 Tax=Massilia sp. W12 TaxID=3126507 RepID=UPI0030CB8541
MSNKIHTHYDNLKVSRNAPAEVIRAAYKALSQKYHPDKNQGDDKAARIMAILNSAYETLSDPQRRKEHDEWIAAEEWEIAWLESTKEDEKEAEAVADHGRRYRPSRDPKWWLVLAVCVALGWGAATVMQMQFHLMPEAPAALPPLASANAQTAPPVASPPPPKVEFKPALSAQITLVGVAQPCALPPRPEFAPNGETWPAKSGLIEGYKVGNAGGDTSLLLDNSANPHDMLVIVYDQARHLPVRHLLLRAQEKFTIEDLAAGRYQVQQQALGLSLERRAECELAEKPAASPIPAAPPAVQAR